MAVPAGYPPRTQWVRRFDGRQFRMARHGLSEGGARMFARQIRARGGANARVIRYADGWRIYSAMPRGGWPKRKTPRRTKEQFDNPYPGRPLDSGLYRPVPSMPDWRRSTDGLQHYSVLNDQAWAYHPFSKEWIQVDRLLIPLVESLWARGINTQSGNTGGDMQLAPQAEHMKEIDDLSINRDDAWNWANLPVEQRFNDSQGYLWISERVAPRERKAADRFGKWDEKDERFPGDIIRWGAAPNVRNLRGVYAAFKVPFPEHLMENGGIKWR